MSHPMHRLPLHASQRSRPRPVSFAPTRHYTSLAAAELVLCTARAVGTAEERASEPFISAVRLYESCHWEFAFERLVPLADQGHTPAAKLALLMLRYGRPLYGANFVAHPGQVARWAQRVLRATSRATASPSSITASA